MSVDLVLFKVRALKKKKKTLVFLAMLFPISSACEPTVYTASRVPGRRWAFPREHPPRRWPRVWHQHPEHSGQSLSRLPRESWFPFQCSCKSDRSWLALHIAHSSLSLTTHVPISRKATRREHRLRSCWPWRSLNPVSQCAPGRLAVSAPNQR